MWFRRLRYPFIDRGRQTASVLLFRISHVLIKVRMPSALKDLNTQCSLFQSMINENCKLEFLYEYLNLIRKCMATPTSRLFYSINSSFINAMNMLNFLLGVCLKLQVDLNSRQVLIKEQQLYLDCAHKVFVLYAAILNYTTSKGINIDEHLKNKIHMKSLSKIVGDNYCDVSSIYVESKFLSILQTMCIEVFGGKWKEDMCELINVLVQQKIAIDNAQDNLSVADIDQYVSIWNGFQAHLLRLIFTNFIVFYNAGIIRCLGVYLNQQIQIKIDFLQRKNEILKKREQTIPPQLIW